MSEAETIQLLDALKTLEKLADAADVYAADQSRATDRRVGLVQPITVEEGEALNVALREARELLEYHDI